jgi:hypothetical protein
MKAEPILRDLEAVKERMAEEAGDDIRRFLDQVDAWLERNPHPGPVVNSPEELAARVKARAQSEPPAPPAAPYRVHDPIIAEIHRIREKLARGDASAAMVLKDEPPKPPDQP